MRRRHYWPCFLLLAVSWAGAACAGDPRAAPAQHDVIPIFLRHCTVCHGPRRQEGGLDLSSRSSMLRGGKSGPAFVSGKPEASRLIQRARSGEMPPRDRLVEASVKPIEPAEIDVVARWIAAGAPEVTLAPDIATTSPDALVTDRDRDFWAFRPPREVAVPRVREAARVRNALDVFVVQKLEARGLTLAPEADRLTLLRRACFDLTGLPPEPNDIPAFLADSAPDAYERLIDRLLASPRYGERWGRYWLDLAGYADSEGKREQDLPRPHAWRYRDYVVRSFNADKPYDRFLLEQIAGDELADYEHAAEITPALYDNLVATGFLRMAPDATWANITGYAPDRVEVIADEIDVLGSAVMGLTLKCARCHNHKFDPIPQRDYYRLAAVFKGAYDEYDWLKPDVRPGLGPVSQDPLGGRLLPFVTSAEQRAWALHNAGLEAAAEVMRAALESVTRVRAQRWPAFLHVDGAALGVLDPNFRKLVEATDHRAGALQQERTPRPQVQALWDRGAPTPTYIYLRGDSLNPGRLVGPGVPSVLTDGKTPLDVVPPWPGARQTGRRLAFARWLVRPDHPLTARVAVNQVWKHHFGAGLVRSLGNFGRTGTPPTHPELLDWLARELVRQGWSVKSLHRLIMTSATYRQNSAVTPEQARLDPENSLLSRMPLTRLDAEALYDTLLAVAGRLDERRFGPADPVRPRSDGLVTPAGSPAGWRRLLYVQQLRKQMPTHLESFDFPQMNPNCVERRDSTVAPQALYLMNNSMIQNLAEQFAQRVMRMAGDDAARQIDVAYRIALSRPPGAEERLIAAEALARLRAAWGGPAKESAEKALASFCHALMNSAAFLYVD